MTITKTNGSDDLISADVSAGVSADVSAEVSAEVSANVSADAGIPAQMTCFLRNCTQFYKFLKCSPD